MTSFQVPTLAFLLLRLKYVFYAINTGTEFIFLQIVITAEITEYILQMDDEYQVRYFIRHALYIRNQLNTVVKYVPFKHESILAYSVFLALACLKIDVY